MAPSNGTSAMESHACAFCLKTETAFGESLQTCGNCLSTDYCSSSCQTKHWTHHERECNSTRKLQPGPLRGSVLLPDLTQKVSNPQAARLPIDCKTANHSLGARISVPLFPEDFIITALKTLRLQNPNMGKKKLLAKLNSENGWKIASKEFKGYMSSIEKPDAQRVKEPARESEHIKDPQARPTQFDSQSSNPPSGTAPSSQSHQDLTAELCLLAERVRLGDAVTPAPPTEASTMADLALIMKWKVSRDAENLRIQPEDVEAFRKDFRLGGENGIDGN